MFKRVIGVTVGAVAAVGMLAGCAPEVVSATPTPVDYKACMLSSVGGFSDGGINQAAYFGLQQAKVEFGVQISQAETAATDSPAKIQSLINKLVSRKCNTVFGIGIYAGTALLNAAQLNPDVNFVQLDARGELQVPVQPENLTRIAFDTDSAYFQAGYLAAEKSQKHIVGVLGASDSVAAKRAIWYFRQGVNYYAADSGVKVELLGAESTTVSSWKLISSAASGQWVKDNVGALTALGADVILPIGIDGLAAAQEAAKTSGVSVIGSDSDWFKQPKFESVKSVILASVQKLIGEQVLNAIGANAPGAQISPSPSPTAIGAAAAAGDGSAVPASQLVQGLVQITPSHGISYPNATDTTLAQLANSIEDGTIVLKPFN
jgi:basic membrane protein A and related proteins